MKIPLYKITYIAGITLWVGSAIVWTVGINGGYLAGGGFILIVLAYGMSN